jgi:phospholipase/carboxylesterase
MQTQTLSLTHLIREPKQKSLSPPPLLLLLHGVGSHERDLFELAPYLDERFFIVSARAPITLMSGAYAWFHVQFMPDDGRPVINPDDAESSRQLLLQFTDELVAAYQLDPKRVYLMGFSQGAIISLSIALTQPDKLAGVVAMSGRILPEVLPMQAQSEAFGRLPIMVVHGLSDQKLDISYGRNARDILSKLPVAFTYREYPMGHEVTQESLRDVSAWLKERLDAKT